MGTKKVVDYFNPDGIIFFEGEFDITTLTEELYNSKMEAIKDNYERVQKYSVLDDWIFENYLINYV
jgi:ribosome-binding ATPase YchF (GTP1/OBG family)